MLKRRRAEVHGRLEELWTAATQITSRLDGMPRAPFHHGGKVEKYVAALADVKKEIAELDVKIIHEEIDLQRYISTVPDSQIRLILLYRFVDCLAWRDVARAISGEATEAGLKQMFKRFIDSEAQKGP